MFQFDSQLTHRIKRGRYFFTRNLKTVMLPLLVIFTITSIGVAPCSTADAQDQVTFSQRSTPSAAYHVIINGLREGEYRQALKAFEGEARGAIKSVTGRWIDSICYETMIGETYYRMGLPEQALEHYKTALMLYNSFNDWMIRVQFPPRITPVARPMLPPWGQSTRNAVKGSYPTSMLIQQGRINNNQQVNQGGIVSQALLFPLNTQEVVRTTTLALRRYAELIGPLGEHDRLAQSISKALALRPGQRNNWSEAWIDVQYGLALLAEGKSDQAILPLRRSLVAAGQFDHPMTSIALLELGKILMRKGDFKQASGYFLEATYAAHFYEDLGVLEEAFYYGTLTHILGNNKTIYPPLERAIEWAKLRQERRELHVSLLLSAAENFAVLGQTQQAINLITEAGRRIGRTDIGAGRLGTRMQYLTAQILFQQGQVEKGAAQFASIVDRIKLQSRKRLQIVLADTWAMQNVFTPRMAMDVYSMVLADPSDADWTFEPMEALAVLLSPHPQIFERWFLVAINRPDHLRAIEIADLARRHRFYCSMPMGGRLLSLRWILDGSEQNMDEASRLRRRDLLVAWPRYAQLKQQAEGIRAQLEKLPLVTKDRTEGMKQSELLKQLAVISEQQEAVLREIALRREPAAMVFPPVRSTADMQQSLPDGHAMLIFFSTQDYIHAFLMNNQQYSYWQLGLSAENARGTEMARTNQPMIYKNLVRDKIGEVLRDIGNFGSMNELSVDDILSEEWKENAEELLKLLLDGTNRKGVPADFSVPFKELAIVPDDVLWYVPFEALQVDVAGKKMPLIGRFRIRYTPTMSLGVETGRAQQNVGNPNAAVVVGKLWPRDDEEVARKAFLKLAGSVRGAVPITSPMPGPSAYYGTLFDQLIVLDDMDTDGNLPYNWAPTSIDSNRPFNRLSDWFRLPQAAPRDVILPGFHTKAETGLKRLDANRQGDEVFLAVTGMMATGSKSLLISRWRTGGYTAFNLVKEYAQELPFKTPADAWQRSVFLTASQRFDVEMEPRIKRANLAEAPKAMHPFFWSGYMLVDSGKSAQQQPAGPGVGPAIVPLGPNPGGGPPVGGVLPQGAPGN